MIEVPPVILFLGAVALWVVPFWLILGGTPRTRTTTRRMPHVKKSRAQHEAELEEMWREQINPAPPTAAERRRWAIEDNQTYIDNVAAFAHHEHWTDQNGDHHWRETVIDNFGNEVEVHNSERTGTRDS